MPSTAKTPLGGDTLVRKWYLDVNSGTHAAPTWVAVNGMVSFQPALNPTLQDDSDFDSGGYKSSTVTAIDWSCAVTVGRKETAASATAYDPGQELLRAAAAGMGASNLVEIRFYEMNLDPLGNNVGPKVEAYQGYAVVSWSPSGGAMDALDQVAMTLTGKGQRNAITHPDYSAVVPTTTSVYPTTAATGGGTLIKITGTSFFKAGVDDVVATTGVKFDTTNAGSWQTISDNVIYAVAPAHAGGTVNVKVTNSAGASVTMCTILYA
jgi:IPT/TIG domain